MIYEYGEGITRQRGETASMVISAIAYAAWSLAMMLMFVPGVAASLIILGKGR